MTALAPIEVEVLLACSPPRAFELWTERIDLWWPRDKSFSGDPAAITFQAEPGGRIYETDPAGREHDWGRVVEVERPGRLRFSWHLMFEPSEATDVEVTFSPAPAGATTVRIVHGGWERLAPDVGAERRRRNHAGWSAIAEILARAAAEA